MCVQFWQKLLLGFANQLPLRPKSLSNHAVPFCVQAENERQKSEQRADNFACRQLSSLRTGLFYETESAGRDGPQLQVVQIAQVQGY